jgi:hypothetical protein
MKRVVFLAVAALMAASMAFAQGGSLGMFADPAGTNCNLADAVPGLVTYYVVHVNTPGATACEFSAPKPACVLATYLSDASVFPVTVGTSQSGVSIGYGYCAAGPINVLKLNYFAQGMTQACCRYPVLPHPITGGPWMVDCANNQLLTTGGQGIVNANPTCQCNVPTEETTWGQVKSLYGE